MGWLVLPASARAHGAAAESAVLSSAPVDLLAGHLDEVIAATPNDEDGAAAALDFYKRLLRLTRQGSRPAVSAVLDHLRLGQRPLLRPDAVVGHLAVAGLLHHERPVDALATLVSLRAEQVPLSAGSFDMLIQHAGRTRDRVRPPPRRSPCS